MAMAWCSPSLRKTPPKVKEEEAGEQEDEDENVQQLEQCARLYKCLEDCLVKTDRNWRACQGEVKALKECHDAKAKKQASPPTSNTAAQIHCFVYKEGACNWCLDPTVLPYDSYELGDVPPEPINFDLERGNFEAAESELKHLGLL